MYRFVAQTEEETEQLAQQLAERLGPGMVLGLDGDLGAGKTRFAQALARGLGVEDTVNSPTFTIIKEYEGRRMPFYHMDVYRLSQMEADELGLDEYFFGQGVTVVEWASLIPQLLPEQRLHVYIAVTGPTSREFSMQPIGESYTEICESMTGERGQQP